MNNIRMAKKLLDCAKMILRESCNKEAKRVLIASDVSEIVRGAVFHYCKDLKQSAQKRGIQMNNFVIHHYLGDKYKQYIGVNAPEVKNNEDAQYVRHVLMLNSRKRRDTIEVNNYLKSQMIVQKDKRITKDKLKQLNAKLLDEISKCVLVPKDFHDWMRRNVIIEDGKYTAGNEEKYIRDRDDFYDFYQDYSRHESYIDEITKYTNNNDKPDAPVQVIWKVFR